MEFCLMGSKKSCTDPGAPGNQQLYCLKVDHCQVIINQIKIKKSHPGVDQNSCKWNIGTSIFIKNLSFAILLSIRQNSWKYVIGIVIFIEILKTYALKVVCIANQDRLSIPTTTTYLLLVHKSYTLTQQNFSTVSSITLHVLYHSRKLWPWLFYCILLCHIKHQ